MEIKTVDDLNRAKNLLKERNRKFPYPSPFSVQVEDFIFPQEFYVPKDIFMVCPWTYLNLELGVKVENPTAGLHTNAMFMEEFSCEVTRPQQSFAVPLLRYDLKKVYSQDDIETHLSDGLVFENHIFVQLLATMLRRGSNTGRKYLRASLHRNNNLFFVRSKNGKEVLVVFVTWSSKFVSSTSYEGWVLTAEKFDKERVFCNTSLYTVDTLMCV
jgi:hypothetical protein